MSGIQRAFKSAMVLAGLALIVLAGRAAHAAPDVEFKRPSQSTNGLPWLDVKLPAPPAPGVPRAKARLGLSRNMMVSPEYKGLRIWAGSAKPKLVPLDKWVDLVVPGDETAPLKIEVRGYPVLAHVRPGDIFMLESGHDGGWAVTIGNRVPEAAPRNLTMCKNEDGECPDGYIGAHFSSGDHLCPPPPGDLYSKKCVKASVVRARGPVGTDGEVRNAQEDGDLIDEGVGTVPLTTKPLAAGEVGRWIYVITDHEWMPSVRIGKAEALLVLGPGESCEVWLDARGKIDSSLVRAP